MTQYIKKILITLSFCFFSATIFAHGLMVNPPARNAVCGLAEDQKPHNATNPACIAAFANDSNGGYQFMSVLTHDVGRAGVTPLPANVCGFDSETFQNIPGNVTPWDTPADWPTSEISSGPLDITWNISWGPHFDDTEEFRYWITKPDFQFDPNTPLNWNQFESEAFCVLNYDDSNPTGNPNVISNTADTTFKTRCNVPSRSGRHVIYGEWGRNFFTFERFHGCIDVTFGSGSNPVPPVATSQSLNVIQNSNLAIQLSGSDSDGQVVSYNVTSQPGNGNLSGNAPSLTYTPNQNFTGNDSFMFTVTDNDNLTSSAATIAISVLEPAQNVAPQASFSVTKNQLAVTFDASTSQDPDSGPQPLSYSWDFGDGSSGSGVNPGHTYTSAGDYAVALTVSDGELTDIDNQTVSVSSVSTPKAKCEYVIANSWSTGFVAEIRLTNTGTQAVNGWDVSWAYNDGTVISNLWSANLSGTNPYSASNLGWNAIINPGQTVSFGFQGQVNTGAQVPTVTGDICQ